MNLHLTSWFFLVTFMSHAMAAPILEDDDSKGWLVVWHPLHDAKPNCYNTNKCIKTNGNEKCTKYYCCRFGETAEPTCEVRKG
uniref:Strongylocin 2-like protein n=1 Tax=Strongylocentrotus intermedius TaxID=7667 RepID=A0A5Q0LSB7_STRIE|nr:strongylocin 2-like protein [Strongylocentrotus intermedius]